MAVFELHTACNNIVDSMQLESDTTIAVLKFDKGREAEIRVCGAVKVEFEGKEYTDVADFPQELKDLIANKRDWGHDDRVAVYNNNWFEFFYHNGLTGVPYSDIVNVEGLPAAEIYSLMSEYVERCNEREFVPLSLKEFKFGEGNRIVFLNPEAVQTICYGDVENWACKEDALEFFREGMDNSEGSEYRRYEQVCFDLEMDYTIATDRDDYKAFSVMCVETKEYVSDILLESEETDLPTVKLDSGKATFGDRDHRMIFYNENEAENVMQALNDNSDKCYTVIDDTYDIFPDFMTENEKAKAEKVREKLGIKANVDR